MMGNRLLGFNLIDEFESILFVDTSVMMLEQVDHKIKTNHLQKATFFNLSLSGQLIIIDFDYNEAVQSDLVHPEFNQADLKSYLSEIGFKRIESMTVYSGSGILMGQDASLFRICGQK